MGRSSTTRWVGGSGGQLFPGAARRLGALVAAILCCAGIVAPPALATPPLITDAGVSGASETSVTLTASVDPNGAKAKPVRFEYISQADYEAAGSSFGAGTVATPDFVVPATVKGTGQITAGSATITGLVPDEGTFGPGQTITETPGIPAGTKINAVTANSLVLSQLATASTADATVKASGPQPVAASIEGLMPATTYRFRVFARNNQTGEEAFGPERSFQTRVPAPVFGPCANDALRSGPGTPSAHPSAQLPDCRAYERASPLEKDGGDAHGISMITRAAGFGAGIVWGSNFGAPGGTGAQVFPFFAAVRSLDGSGWSSQGILPPAVLGADAQVRGWIPDFSEVFVEATRLGSPSTTAFFELHRDGGAPTQITPYLPFGKEAEFTGGYSYVGASADAQTIVFESPAAVPATAAGDPQLLGAKEGGMNVYAWDANSGQVSLLSTMNSEAENEAALPNGAFAGPYDWAIGRTRNGGSSNRYYLTEQHALSPEADSLYFTAFGSGQLYRRVNPTEPQSAIDAGKCTEPDKACTVHISATDRTPPDPTGTAPAAFQYASTDGSQVFFTSSEELTDDANTGPEQPPARIGRTDLAAPDPDAAKEEGFLPANATGITASADGEFIYWADPVTGKIGRADLKAPNPADTREPAYVDPGPGECEVKVKIDPEHFEVQKLEIPSTPRYVAIDPAGKYLYWTNTGLHGGEKGLPIDGGGTIGRAELDAAGNVVDVDPDFICGETEPTPGTREKAVSNPQGIAVNASHIYWANAATQDDFNRSLARARVDGGEVRGHFVAPPTFNAGEIPQGVALDGGHVYLALDSPVGSITSSYVRRFTLEGAVADKFDGFGVGVAGIRGLAVDGTYAYWAKQEEEAIGRAPLADLDKGGCFAAGTSCETELVTPEGALTGLAIDGTHLYWSVNGETPPNPGSDLYRYNAAAPAGEELTDLTPDPSLNGAEVKGVIGGSPDGSYLYLVANGDLDGSGADGGEASVGDCHRTDPIDPIVKGACSLYLLHDGELAFIARLDPGAHSEEFWNWLPYRNLPGTRQDPKTAAVSADGRTLLFRSAQDLGGYEAHNAYQLYRYRVGEGIICVSCDPSGEAAAAARVGLGVTYGNGATPVSYTAATTVRFLSADGNRAFFETAAALVPGDTNAQAGCPALGSLETPACQDVYEWEAPGAGSCSEGGPGYSAANRGCLYLVSTGRSSFPSYFADASPDGSDVYFLTRERLVGTDTDDLLDVYDARVGGGLTAQNAVPVPPCEGEGCKPAATPPPPFMAPPNFTGPGNPKPQQPKCKKGKKKKGCTHKHRACKKKKKTHCTVKHQGGSR